MSDAETKHSSTVPTAPTAAERYPFDYDAFEKGDYIKPDELEDIIGISRELAAYGIPLLKLSETLQAELDCRHKGITVVRHKDGLLLLGDQEAVKVGKQRGTHAMRKLQREARIYSRIDRSQLSSEEQKGLEQAELINGASLATIGRIRRSFPQLARNGSLAAPDVKQIENNKEDA